MMQVLTLKVNTCPKHKFMKKLKRINLQHSVVLIILDLNSHFKNLNTSNTSLTFGEPHKPKHTLSTLSSKHDSMCHEKYVFCIGQKS